MVLGQDKLEQTAQLFVSSGLELTPYCVAENLGYDVDEVTEALNELEEREIIKSVNNEFYTAEKTRSATIR